MPESVSTSLLDVALCPQKYIIMYYRFTINKRAMIIPIVENDENRKMEIVLAT